MVTLVVRLYAREITNVLKKRMRGVLDVTYHSDALNEENPKRKKCNTSAQNSANHDRSSHCTICQVKREWSRCWRFRKQAIHVTDTFPTYQFFI